MKIIHAVIRKLRPFARHPDGVRIWAVDLLLSANPNLAAKPGGAVDLTTQAEILVRYVLNGQPVEHPGWLTGEEIRRIERENLERRSPPSATTGGAA